MRQMEGAYLSNDLVERSQVRLQRLPYIESVEHETTPVPGSPDLVDVDFTIEEGLPGQFGGSLGFSETYGVTLGEISSTRTSWAPAIALRWNYAAASIRRSTTSISRTCIGTSTASRERFPHLSGHHAIHLRNVRLLHDDARSRPELGI